MDQEGNRVYVFRSKVHRHEWMPMHPLFKAVLLSMDCERTGRIFTRYKSKQSVSRAIKAALRNAGLGHLRLHHLRHTFASHLLMSGQSMKAVGELLGHASIQSTQVYAHLTQDYLQDAMETLKFGPIDLLK